MEKMLEAARQEYRSFLDRQKHFRPEDRAIFITEFLASYCQSCGGMKTKGRCYWCAPIVKSESTLQLDQS